MTSPSPIQIHALWDRPFIPVSGGSVILCLHLQAIETAPGNRPPLDLAFVLDRSGSMSGEPLELVRQGVSTALDFLDDGDRVALVTFDHEYRIWQELAGVSASRKARLRHLLQMITPGGSTDLTQGWLQGCGQLAHTASTTGRIRRAILLTDGQANTGITDPAAIARIATEYRQSGITTTTVGVGAHFDELLLSSVSEAGGGNFKYIGHPAELPTFFANETGDMTRIVATALRLDLHLGSGITGRLLNAFPATVHGETLRIDLRDLVAGDTLDLILELDIPAGAEDRIITAALHFGDGQMIAVPLPHLQRRVATEIAGIAPDPEVLQKHALELSTRARREAMRLDRAGDITGSRTVLREAFVTLDMAPASPKIRALSHELMTMAEETKAFDENTRKRVVHESHAQSRGYKR
jgi:Ca-activated chloride channel family protein